MATFESTTLTNFYSTMAAAVNSQAPNLLVMFEPQGIDSTSTTTNLTKPTGNNLVFAPHYYQSTPEVGQGPGSIQAIGIGLSDWAAIGAMWNMPIFLGEMGASHGLNSAAQFMSAHYDALDKLQMGATEWEYSVTSSIWNDESLGMVAEDGGEYPVASAIIRVYPRAIAGTQPVYAFDSTMNHFTMTYTSTTGITELVVPSRLYPNGMNVTITGGCADLTRTDGIVPIEATSSATTVSIDIASK
jgi:endoglycosylceramidase